jgi:murein DD-endopeptidase MepM/ murein hydrolase activator NlpD
MNRKWLPTILTSLMLCLSFNTFAQSKMIYVLATETYFKRTTADSSALAAADKCLMAKGFAVEVSNLTDASATHFAASLPRAIGGCGLTSGYFYKPHVTASNLAITVHRATVFKKTTADSSTLPASDKCDMPVDVYGLSATPADVASHFGINMRSFLPGCGFSVGYVYEGHAVTGVQAMTLTSSAYLKTSTADSSTLPASSKCLIAAGNYTLAAPPATNADHYQITLAKSIAGCALSGGYVFYANTTFHQPTGGVSSYEWPMPNGGRGSNWCVCRTVGTSPHIGQDILRFDGGAMQSVAVNNGKVTDKYFDSSCGWFVEFTDNSGALWRYVHLNSPAVSIGQVLTKGQFIGNHGSYPLSACGTGPHLHFERKTAGGFNDSETFKTCQNGTKSCNYNPMTPFPNFKNADTENILGFSPAGTWDAVEVNAPVVDDRCRIEQKSYPKAAAPIGYSSLNAARVELDAVMVADEAGIKHLHALAALKDNPANLCGTGHTCITSWSVLAQQKNGSRVRLFEDASIRNRMIEREAAEQYCAPDATNGKFVFLFNLSNGEKIQIERRL